MSDNGLGRPEKVFPAEVQEQIERNGKITVGELAEILDCHPETIRNKLRKLRNDGVTIMHDEDGVFIMDEVRKQEDAESVRKFLSWVIRSARGVLACGQTTRHLIAESKKYLRESLSSDERKAMATNAMLLSRLLDYVSIDEEIGN